MANTRPDPLMLRFHVPRYTPVMTRGAGTSPSSTVRFTAGVAMIR